MVRFSQVANSQLILQNAICSNFSCLDVRSKIDTALFFNVKQIVGYDTHFYIISQIMTLILMLFKLPISYLSFMGNYEDDEPSVDIYACQPLTSTL